MTLDTSILASGPEKRVGAIRNVLVVDDEKNIRITLADILVGEGY